MRPSNRRRMPCSSSVKSGRITSYNRNFTEMWNMPDPVLNTLDTRAAAEYASVQVKDPDGFLARVKEISDHPQREAFDTIESA